MVLPQPVRRASPALVLVALALALLALPRSAAAQRDTVTVTISFNAQSGAISVSPDPVTVTRPGTRLQWASNVPDWQVTVQRGNRVFGGGNDEARVIRGRSDQAGRPQGAIVVPGAPGGRYKYDIQVMYGGNPFVLDPEIILNF